MVQRAAVSTARLGGARSGRYIRLIFSEGSGGQVARPRFENSVYTTDMIAHMGFDDLLARAMADDVVLGLVLTGSQARGMATSSSDHDVYVIVERRGGVWDQ